MKYLTATALAALLVGSMSLGGLVPARADDTAASAPPAPTQTTAPPADNTRMGMGNHRHMGRHGGQGMRLLDFACSARSAEALEIGLVRVKYAVKPTAAQIPLFDALRTAALDGQKTFADACTAARGSGMANGASIVDRLQQRLNLDTARVTALGEVMPKLKAFYDSLTPEQQQALQHRGAWGNGQRPGAGGWQHRFRSGMHSAMPHARMHQDNQPTEANPTAPAAPTGDATPAGSSD